MRAALLLRRVMEPSYPLALIANQHAYTILQQKKTFFIWDIVRNAGSHAEVRKRRRGRACLPCAPNDPNGPPPRGHPGSSGPQTLLFETLPHE